jgi:hypothetical protein
MPFKPREGFKRRGEVVPVPVALALRYGKLAYQQHSTCKNEPDDECMEVYLICGQLIRNPDAGKRLWAAHRDALLRVPGVQSWWGYKQFEKRSKQVKSEK